ncbi:MAG: barstar family protein [Nitrospiraceae bacterium]|nr:barstar family protein [Nitrospiraceae bacterium]
MPVILCVLDGTAVRSLEDFYDQLAARLPLPEHFGRNLDALWDVLSTEIEGPFEIAWKNSHASRKAMGPDYDRVLKLLQDLKQERKDFRLKIEP